MSELSVIDRITEALSPLIEENTYLKESIDEVRMMFDAEDKDWISILGGYGGDEKYDGLSLDQVKKVADHALKQVAIGAIPKRAADLHFGFVFGNGWEIEGVERVKGKRGATSGIVKFYEDAVNRESLFSGAAQHELQYARFITGNVIAYCDKSKKQVRRIPLHEITRYIVDPDFPEDVWAYLREWTYKDFMGKEETRKTWIYTYRFSGVRPKSIEVGSERIPVDQNAVVVDLRVNRQVGFALGVPDAAAGLLWSRAYGEVLRYGQIVNQTLATVVHKVVQRSKTSASSVGVKMGNASPGSAAVVGEGQDIQLVNSSQKSFDFAAARPLAAMAATAWNVSVVDLLSDSSAAGSSYGAGNLLTAGMQNAMNGMRNEWSRFYQDIFEVMGFNRPAIYWPPMEEPDPYRKAQELMLYSPALSDEELRGETLNRLNITGDPKVIPPSLKARSAAPKQTASPDQGKSNGTGGQDSGTNNDQRTDKIESLRSEFALGGLIEEMKSILEEFRSERRV